MPQPVCSPPPLPSPLRIGPHQPATRYFLAPLAGYTHLAFRQVIREQGGLGWATTDLVQAMHLLRGTAWARELVATTPEDQPLSVQIYGGVVQHLVDAARWLEDRGYAVVDINMGCPMAKINGQGGGARLMCRGNEACDLVARVVAAVRIPVTIKMRLGWDRDHITAPELARQFEEQGVAAITIHGRTRQQGFRGEISLAGIRAVVEAVRSIPVIGNGDVRTPADARHMYAATGCAGIAIGRGALLDPWIFKRLQLAETCGAEAAAAFDPTPEMKLTFLRRHFELMVRQRGEYSSCLMFRKFAAWYGAQLGIPEPLEDRLRCFESIAEFERIAAEIAARTMERSDPRPTAFIKVPNGPVEYW